MCFLCELACSYFSLEEEGASIDVWDMLRDMRAKFSLAKSLLKINDSSKEPSEASLRSKNKESSNSKTLAW